jgi:geranylgeranyl reductase family protein
MQTPDADVIIAGGGPAGSVAAGYLAKAGYSVLILEKSEFPRYKVCGGGLTHKILQEIPFDVTPVIEAEVRSIRFSRKFQDVFTRESPDPLMYCTMRSRLDQFMLDEAGKAGAKLLYGMKVTGMEQDSSGVTVYAGEKQFRSKLLIGADGASGMVARLAGLRKDLMPGLAWEAEIRPDAAFLEKYSGTVFLDWGTFPGGYAWIFPKKDHVSVGVGGPAALSSHMMEYYRRFLDSVGIPEEKADVLSLKSWPIPVRIRKGDFHSGRCLVTGDAAGLTDALTGEGIYYAVRSGHLSAHACIDFLSGKRVSLSAYSEEINRELMPELIEARRIGAIFNTMPAKVHGWVRDNDRVWRAMGKVLRGERMYADVRSIFGRWRFLWEAACAMLGIAASVREKKFKKGGFRE